MSGGFGAVKLIVSHKNEFVFVHIPKCAGSSFRSVIAPYHDDAETFWSIRYDEYFQRQMDYAHLRLWELAAIQPNVFAALDRYKTVVFARNPYQRFVSAIAEHYSQYRPHEPLLELNIEQQLAKIEDFVRTQLTIGQVLSDFRYVHFSPQAWFIQLGRVRKIKNVVPMLADRNFSEQGMRCLGLPMTKMPTLNSKSLDVPAILTSPVVLSFVREFYQQDFQLFEGHEDLRPLVEIAVPRRNTAVGVSEQVNTVSLPQPPSSSNLHGMLEAGLRHHQTGQLAEAEQLYRQVLAIDARHTDALHLLGLIAHQVGQNNIAVELIGKAIEISPAFAAYHSNLGIVLQALGRPDKAAAAYNTAIRLQPDFTEAYSNLGNTLLDLERPDDAVTAYNTAIRLKPDFTEAHFNLDVAQKELERRGSHL